MRGELAWERCVAGDGVGEEFRVKDGCRGQEG
ncbi:MAG: hypothetical protein KatS3mg132_462 [Limisphaera sp.]|nr:MAG: hypothetical protein KatS3mg132_462 [Limisphaera sp.]